MLQGVAEIFGNRKNMLKGLKKKSYEANMEMFERDYGHYLTEMLTALEKAPDAEVAAQEVSEAFVSEVKNEFAKGKKNQIPSLCQVDLNFFMIYYVFPALLRTEHPHCKQMTDTLCETWGNTFNDSKIGYSDYDTIYESFREKIFGLF